MVLQYLIDWGYLRRHMQPAVAIQLMSLRDLIEQNGVLIDCQLVRKSLNDWIEDVASSDFAVATVLQEFLGIYNDRGLSIESEFADKDSGSGTDDFEVVFKCWKQFLVKTGKVLARCAESRVLIGAGELPTPGVRFCRPMTLESVQYKSERPPCQQAWMKMQSFSDAEKSRSDFETCLEAFVSSSAGNVRIYDPYIALAFVSNRRAWRISLAYLVRAFSLNLNVKRIDIVTAWKGLVDRYERDAAKLKGFHLAEVIDHALAPAVGERGADLTIAFHFLKKEELKEAPVNLVEKENLASGEDAFHDRFIANENYCFAIGHGCDVCLRDQVADTCPRNQRVAKALPAPENRHLGSFNVFFGVSRVERQGLSVFGSKGNMYPPKWQVMPVNKQCLDAQFDYISGDIADSISRTVRLSSGKEVTLSVRLSP